jgi:hypothetical protein
MYKVTAGRAITNRDVELFYIKPTNIKPVEANAMAHYICALLNESKTSFPEFLIKYMQS